MNSLQRALTFDPGSATLNQNLLAAYHRWGVHYLKTDQFSEAFKCFERGLKRFPFSDILLSDLAATQASVGNTRKPSTSISGCSKLALTILLRELDWEPR